MEPIYYVSGRFGHLQEAHGVLHGHRSTGGKAPGEGKIDLAEGPFIGCIAQVDHPVAFKPGLQRSADDGGNGKLPV
jgi:hypothetical protein